MPDEPDTSPGEPALHPTEHIPRAQLPIPPAAWSQEPDHGDEWRDSLSLIKHGSRSLISDAAKRTKNAAKPIVDAAKPVKDRLARRILYKRVNRAPRGPWDWSDVILLAGALAAVLMIAAIIIIWLFGFIAPGDYGPITSTYSPTATTTWEPKPTTSESTEPPAPSSSVSVGGN